MNKLFECLICTFICLGLFGCNKDDTEYVMEDYYTDPVEFLEDEIIEDENYREYIDYNKKLSFNDIKGQYEVFIYTVFGQAILKDSEEWNEMFEKTDSFSVNITDKKHAIFKALEGEYNTKYELKGNQITLYFESLEDEEENAPIEGVILDDCMILDLDGAKLFLVKVDAEKGVYEEIEELMNDITI